MIRLDIHTSLPFSSGLVINICKYKQLKNKATDFRSKKKKEFGRACQKGFQLVLLQTITLSPRPERKRFRQLQNPRRAMSDLALKLLGLRWTRRSEVQGCSKVHHLPTALPPAPPLPTPPTPTPTDDMPRIVAFLIHSRVFCSSGARVRPSVGQAGNDGGQDGGRREAAAAARPAAGRTDASRAW